MDIDANEIVPGVWQGSAPLERHAVRQAGFQALVLCAKEYQPPGSDFPGVAVHHAPFDDSGPPPTPREIKIAREAARQVVEWRKQGLKVLVTCAAGINRSGLVSALAVRRLCGVSGRHARVIVQTARRGALGNPHFADLLNSLAPPQR